MSAQPDYYNHLKSDYWRAVRNIALQVAGERCALCGLATALEVHHNTYENLGKETLQDVIVLCSDCHERHHFPGEELAPRVEIREVLVVDGPDTMTDEDRATFDRIWGEVFDS